MIKTLLDYINRGGCLFVSGEALYYVFNLGLEKVEPRKLGTSSQPLVWGLAAAEGKEGHPVFEGFDNLADIPMGFDSGHTCADFYGKGELQGEVIGDCTIDHGGPRRGDMERPVVLYEHGKGKVLTHGWRTSHWIGATKEKEYRQNLEQFTANVINWLGEESAFKAVQPKGKLAITWGKIKLERY